MSRAALDAFPRSTFLGADRRARMELVRRLEAVLSGALLTRAGDEAGEPPTEREGGIRARVAALIEELESLGHELVLHKRTADREVWGPQFAHPTIAGLMIEFTAPSDVSVEWLG
jgi:hypothetical protein